ncbi:hypothetical protein GGR57DRAFT_465051 [Xylariaceae sp. FL1272]|nr:hypothetical protein GGR57DRAFT_465051 [Xylariaceae sp. FL1272]
MATTSQYIVHTGLWTNWSYGQVFGATLTLSTENGSLLTAFLALTVTVIGTQLWRIFCFLAHQLLSSADEQNDALYHQVQATLRTTSEPGSGLVRLLQLVVAWRTRGVHVVRRLVPVLAATIVITVGTALGSGYSSKVAVGNEVLLKGDTCAWVQINGNTDAVAEYTVVSPYMDTKLQVDATYAQQCYSQDFSPGELGCGTFVQKQIPFSVTTNAPCPFPNDTRVCQTNDSNIVVDTGLMDSHFDMGLNLPAKERFQYRRVMSCAPLSVERYSQSHNLSATRSTMRYFYGTPLLNDKDDSSNHTYETSNNAYSDREAVGQSGGFPKYSIRPFTAMWENGTLGSWGSTFAPIPELTVPDADLKLLFLSGNGIYFTNVTYDPWYKATTPGYTAHPLTANKDSGIEVYLQDNPATPMGCVHRSQYCRPGRSGNAICTRLTGESDLYYSTLEVFDDEHAFNRVSWFQTNVDASWWPEDIVGRGDVNLAAQFRVRTGVQGPLPDDQWHTEVQYWFSIMLASMQRTFVDAAMGPSDPNLKSYRVPPANADEEYLCTNQKILSADHISFSVFGLLFIFVFGGIIIMLGLSLDSIVGYIQRIRKSSPHHRLEWCSNGTLQLQRLAHEALGYSTWDKCARAVPTTSSDARLGILDISRLDHPIYVLESKGEDSGRSPETSCSEL